MQTKQHNILILLFSIIMCLFLCISSYADIDGNIFDDADLFTATEEATLLESCLKIEEAYNVEIFVMTFNDNPKSSAESYLKNYIVNNTDKMDNAIGLLIDMEHREYSFQFNGDYFYDALSDSEQDSIQNHIASNLGKGDYYATASHFLSDVDSYCGSMNRTSTGYVRSIRLLESVLQIAPVFLVGLFLGLVISISMTRSQLKQHKEKVTKKEAFNYVKNSQLVLTENSDTFIRKYTTSTRKSSSSSSGGGSRSSGGGSRSSGRSSGGRSGKF